MRWYYEKSGQTHGPVEDQELRNLVQQGVLNYGSRIILEVNQTGEPSASTHPS